MTAAVVYPYRRKGFDFSHVGPENEHHARQWQDCMDLARIEIDNQSLKESFIWWAKQNRDMEEIQYFVNCPVWRFIMLGRIAFCIQHGAVMPENVEIWFHAKIAELLAVNDSDATTQEPERVLTLQQKRNLEYVNLYSRLEAYCTNYQANIGELETQTQQFLQRNEVSRPMLKRLYDHFKESFSDAMAERNNPYVEKTIPAILSVVNVLATITGNAKAMQPGKAMNTRSIKQASKAQYKQLDMDTAVASMSPAMIPGSKMVLLYNAKTRKLSYYTAEATAVLEIKGSKILNFDANDSYAKTLRKPKQILASLRDAVTIKRIDIVLGDYIKGKKHEVTGKLTKDTLILKVIR